MQRDHPGKREVGVPAAPPAARFRLMRYFTVASLAAFVLVAVPLLYFERREDQFSLQLLQQQNAFFTGMQNSFVQRDDAGAPTYLLGVYEEANINLTRLFANALWEKDFAPFVAKARRIPVDQCRAIADVKGADGKTVPSAEKQACNAGIGRQIMALPEFHALDAKLFNLVKKSTVFKIKVLDLRGITVYSSEHDQIGEDKTGNAGWESAMAGKPASQLTSRGKSGAFEGEVANRDIVSSYVPVLVPGSERIVAVFEVYSDVTHFLDQIKSTSSEIRELSAAHRAQLERAMAAHRGKMDESTNLLLAIVLGLLALLYCALLLIVRRGQRVIDKEKVELDRTEEALSASASHYRAVVQTATDAIITADGAGTITGWNPAAERMFGYTEAEVIGQPLTLVIPERYRGDHWVGVKRVQADGEQHLIGRTVEFHGLTKAGGEFQLELSVSTWETSEGRMFAGIIHDITERKQTEQALHDNAKRLRGLWRRLIAVEETARRNINRELHDRVGQHLAALNINLNIIRSQLSQQSRDAVGTRLQDTQTLLEGMAAHVRDVLADLHPPGLDDYGLLAALRTYVETFGARFAVPITVHGEYLAPRLSLAAEMALFRVAQGALANAATHAHAKRIQVLLAATTDRATLTIADDGVGFDVAHAALAHASWGLAIMRERAEVVGATLRIDTAPGRGTRVVVEIERGAA